MDYIEYAWQTPDTYAHRYLFPSVKRVIDKLRLMQDMPILDAGCGGGALVNYLHRLGFKNIYGFDASSTGIEIAKKNFPEISDKFFIHNCYEENLPINHKFKLIISMEIIEHLYSPTKYLKNIYNWLDNDGYFILTTPYHGYLKNFLIAFLNKFDRHFSSLEEGGHIKFFSKKTLTLLLDSIGFKFIKFYGAGRIPYLWKSMVILAKKKMNKFPYLNEKS